MRCFAAVPNVVFAIPFCRRTLFVGALSVTFGWPRLFCAAGGDGRMHLAGLSPQNRSSRGAARCEASAAASSKTKIPVGNDRQDGEISACGRKA
jgi:hypothetical protein